MYRSERELPEADLALMRRIDELHLEYPFLGSRQLRDSLRLEGHRIGRKRVRRPMQHPAYVGALRPPIESAPFTSHSPHRPGVNQRETKVAFWKCIAERLPSDAAASACNVSQPLGPR